MLQYVLTAVAGVVLGIVALRIWQAREPEAAPEAVQTQDTPRATDPEPAKPASAPLGSTRNLLIGAGGLVAAAAAVLVLRPADSANSTNPVAMAGAMSPGSGKDKALDDVDTMITKLAERLKANPGDGDGFRMLGWSLVMTGHPEKALEPYQRAMALLPANASVHEGYGEALTGTAGGKVTPEAKAAFAKALALDPAEPRAAYFLALWQAQNGQEREALEKWIGLANKGPADATWQADVHKQIGETAQKLGMDVSSRLKAAPPAAASAMAPNMPSAMPAAGTMPPVDASAAQAAAQLPAGDQQAMIANMVNGLANRLKTNPGDVDGWIKLLRARMVLNQHDMAKSELALARMALKTNPDGLARINAAARQFKVPGAQ